jgi:hypothetical protein
MTEDNSTKNYNEFVRVNLPSGMTYNGEVDRYQINNHSFFKFKQADWYYKYIIKYGFSPEESFSPAILFANNEQGVWYDPSPETTFTDTAGTTPATVGSAVALMLDKSKGLVLGPELVTNGTFDADTDWTKSGWTISTGAASYDGTVTANSITQSISAAVGKLYAVTFDVTFGSGANEALVISLESTTPLTKSVTLNKSQGNGTYTFFLVCVEQILRFNANRSVASGSLFSGTIDNISVKELPGNHATQSVTAARPILARVPARGRANLLTYSENFTQWTNLAATVTTNTISDLSTSSTAQISLPVIITAGAQYTFTAKIKKEVSYPNCFVGFLLANGGIEKNFDPVNGILSTAGSGAGDVLDQGTHWLIHITGTAAATGSNPLLIFPARSTSLETVATSKTGTGLITIDYVQLEEGSTASAYQKVTSTYDVTEAGQADKYLLWFDGIDDSMVTPTITPGIDKVQVFAGVRKLIDATGMIAETSAGSNNGTFNLYTFTTPRNVFTSRGTVFTEAVANFASAPASMVLTGIGDIAGDNATLRVNGTQAAQSTSNQGTGNYLAYPLYIGSRGGTSLRFNGQLFQLITRFGANLDANVITQTETYVAGKTAGVELT